MKFPTHDLETTCAVLFDEWCAEELVDPRLREILEEAFVNGFIARDSLEYATKQEHAA
jgi:hypothetical protein